MGLFKDQVYQGSVTNEADLKVRHVSFIPTDMLYETVDKAVDYFQYVFGRKDMPIENKIVYTYTLSFFNFSIVDFLFILFKISMRAYVVSLYFLIKI